MQRLSITLSPVTLDCPVTMTSCDTSHATPMVGVIRDMLISDGGAI
jgi:hypothetical protein